MAISPYLRDLRAKVGHALLVVPAVDAMVFNAEGQLLLQRSRDNGRWYLVGGAIDPGEEPADAVVREAFEETGVTVVPERIVGVYTDLVHYANDDETYYICTTFACRPVAGTPHVNDDESLEVRYFDINDLPELTASQRARVDDALKHDSRAAFRWQGS